MTRISRLGSVGFRVPEEIEFILNRLATLFASVHRKGKRAFVLVDLRGNSGQRGETVERVGRRSASIYERDDQLAIVLQSGLARIHATRVECMADYMVFSALGEAEAWLRLPLSTMRRLSSRSASREVIVTREETRHRDLGSAGNETPIRHFLIVPPASSKSRTAFLRQTQR